jgi:hypothetical protein
MKTYWDQDKPYRVNYAKLLNDLYHDTRPWIKDQEPPKDGTQLYFLCQSDYMGDPQYDVGCWADYTESSFYSPDAGYPECLEGEWDTDFGNCEQILGWKPVL